MYSVLSRRTGGVSVGINLHPNKACNWRCVYCQVPGLQLGVGPAIDLGLLERELEAELERSSGANSPGVTEGPTLRVGDIAFSGDGEPTNSPDFAAAVEVGLSVRARRGLEQAVPLVLITNGSLVDRPKVRPALERLGGHGGRVWFKLDAVSEAAVGRMNSTRQAPERVQARLLEASRACPTWIQTMLLAFDGPSMDERERERYCEFLHQSLSGGAQLRGVHLYGLARQSHQPEAPQLRALPSEELHAFARQIHRHTGLEVQVHP